MLPLNFRGGCGNMHLIRETNKISVHVCKAEGAYNQLSTRTSRMSGQKHCRVDKMNCRVEKCISLGRHRKY